MGIEEYISDSNDLFKGEPWFGNSIMSSLQNIPLEKWNLKPENASNSIAAIVFHMIDWRYFVVEKLKGNTSFDIELNTKADWRENVNINSEEERKAILMDLSVSQKELMSLVKEKEAYWLRLKTVGKEYTNSFMLQGVLQHDAYHLGQINLIQSQLKNL